MQYFLHLWGAPKRNYRAKNFTLVVQRRMCPFMLPNLKYAGTQSEKKISNSTGIWHSSCWPEVQWVTVKHLKCNYLSNFLAIFSSFFLYNFLVLYLTGFFFDRVPTYYSVGHKKWHCISPILHKVVLFSKWHNKGHKANLIFINQEKTY